MLTNYWKFQNRSVQTFGFVYHDTNGQNQGPVWKIQSFLLSEICMVILWQDCYWKGNLRKYFWNTVGRKFPNWECLFVHREKGLFLSVYVDDIKLAGRKQNIDPMWKVLNKEVDLGEPTSFLDHENLGCTQRQCGISKDIVDNYRTMFESRISAGATENCHARKIWVSLRGPMTWKVMPRNVWSHIVSKQTRRLNNSTKYLLHAVDDHHFKEEELKSVGELSKVCSQIVLKCLYLARIGRRDIIWSVNKLARSIIKWTKACDKRLNRLISYTHHTCEYKQYCHVGNTAKQCRLGTFSRLRLCGRCWGFKVYFKWNIVRFWKSYICSNKLDVQETNFSFTQFNRIRNHRFGCRIEAGWYSRTCFMGSDCLSPWKHESESERTGRPVNEQTWSSFTTSHNSKTQEISESDQWFG